MENKHFRIAKWLIKNGTTKNESIFTEISLWAANKGYINIIDFLISENVLDFNAALRSASGEGHLELVKLIMKSGGDTQAALNWAAGGGHLEIAKLMLENGAVVYEEDLDEAGENFLTTYYSHLTKEVDEDKLEVIRPIVEEAKKQQKEKPRHLSESVFEIFDVDGYYWPKLINYLVESYVLHEVSPDELDPR